MKDQWKKGLQWGGLIWLAYLAASSIWWFADQMLLASFNDGQLLRAMGWTLAFALAWTRWSRLGIVIGVAAHVYAGFVLDDPPSVDVSTLLVDGVQRSFNDYESIARRFVPACLPVLPLLFMRPERPVYAAALAMVGRWNDAAREVEGLRWILVAAGVFLLSMTDPDAVRYWAPAYNAPTLDSILRVVVGASPPAILFGLAALRDPRERVSAR